jgi:acetylglutamate kinase
VAKLRACMQAVEYGVRDVSIADGRQPQRLGALLSGTAATQGPWTRMTHSHG